MRSLLSGAVDQRNPDARLFAMLVAARASRNELALLGLSHTQLTRLLARHFPALSRDVVAALAAPFIVRSLQPAHVTFVATLHALLLRDIGAAVAVDDADCVASIVAHACLRGDHLWRDLGLDGRDAVAAMLDRYFPAVAARNVGQLRWKKFLAQEAAASLRLPPEPAPGCPDCEDFPVCFPLQR
nr:nitrogen fixation protein NifQ [Burkholderia multivorans]